MLLYCGNRICDQQVFIMLYLNNIPAMPFLMLQAFFHVSRILSECRFEALEGLVAKDVSRVAPCQNPHDHTNK